MLSAFERLGSPNGWGMPIAGMIRFAPTVNEMGTTVAICATGIPTRSISFAIVAPQRVQVPHVEVRITAEMLSCSKRWAISLPKPLALLVDVPVPVVTI